jgi:HlyD family secretion protein
METEAVETAVARPAPQTSPATDRVQPTLSPPRAKKRRITTLALATLAVVIIGAIWFLLRGHGTTNVLEASGTVEATEAVLGFAAGGRIRVIVVHEGERAGATEVLAELDTTELMAHVRQLRDQATLAQAQLRDLELGARPQELDDRRQAVTAAQRTLDDAEADLRRMGTLVGAGAVSEQTFEKTQVARDLAMTRYAQTRAELSLAEEGTRQQQVAAARASLAATRSQLAAVEATIPNYFVRAPWTGLVTNRVHEPGEAIAAGSPVLTVTNPNDRWVRIYIPENEVGMVRVGQHAAISSDAFPNRPLAGHLRWISTDAEFTPRNVQTKDDRVRLVYAAKVQIDGDSLLVLKPGTPADVRIDLTPH